MKILFISRAYPPIVGGIENQNYALSLWLSKIAEVRIIANRYGRKFLPIFAPIAAIQALLLIKKYDVVLLGDGVLSVVGWLVKIFTKKPVVCVIHGLDINYNSASLGVWYEKALIFLYRKFWLDIFIKKMDHFIAVGNETVNQAIKAGILPEKIVFIPNGVDTDKFSGKYPREKLDEVLGENSDGKKFLLTSGRLVKRKGGAWFIRNVLPSLPENVIYLVAGAGPDQKNIEAAIKESRLEARVRLLGYISDETRNILFGTCDIFIQPNIKVEGDMEGFGISVLEAASSGIPVVASRLEGLQDAIKDRQNGFLVESKDAAAWVAKINEILGKDDFRQEFGEKARQFVIDNYSWGKISRRYLEEIEKIL